MINALKFSLLDKNGNPSCTKTLPLAEALKAIEQFVILHGTDPDEDGKDAMPGSVTFEPATLPDAAAPSELEKYATVSWSVADVQTLFDIDAAKAAEFLQNNANKIRDRLIELGWGVIETFGQMDDLPLTDPE
jgi:hypothetical protein